MKDWGPGDDLAGLLVKLSLGRTRTALKEQGLADGEFRGANYILMEERVFVTALILDTQTAGGSAGSHRQQLTSGSVREQSINGTRGEEDLE